MTIFGEISMKHFKIICLLLIIGSYSVFAQYEIRRSVFGNGGNRMQTTDKIMKSTMGQSIIGKAENASYQKHIGFWYAVDFIISDIMDEDIELPKKFELLQNYPNPFNPVTTIRFALPEAEQVKLEVYSLLGRRVTTLLNEYKNPGIYEVRFNASSLATGFYVYRIQAGRFGSVKKMMIMK